MLMILRCSLLRSSFILLIATNMAYYDSDGDWDRDRDYNDYEDKYYYDGDDDYEYDYTEHDEEEEDDDDYEEEDNSDYDDDDYARHTDESDEETQRDDSRIIVNVMKRKGVKPSDIPRHSARQGVRGFGRFKCSSPECVDDNKWSWSSRLAHIVFDLRKQEVARKWKQKCRRCLEDYEPFFSTGELTSMIERAIEQEMKYRNMHSENGTEDHSRSYDYSGPPHESSLCEKCIYLKKPCWKKGH